MVRRRIWKLRKQILQNKAALVIQRFCKGHLTAKHYIHFKGDISIDTSLYSLKIMKNKIGDQLARMLTFIWRTYKRKKERLAAEEKARKAKAKKGGKKKKGTGRTNSVASNSVSKPGASFAKGRASVALPNTATSTLGKSVSESPSPQKVPKAMAKAKSTMQPDDGAS